MKNPLKGFGRFMMSYMIVLIEMRARSLSLWSALMNPSPLRKSQIKERTIFEASYQQTLIFKTDVDSDGACPQETRHGSALTGLIAEKISPGEPGYKIKLAFHENLAANSSLVSPRISLSPGFRPTIAQYSPNAAHSTERHVSPSERLMSPVERQVFQSNKQCL